MTGGKVFGDKPRQTLSRWLIEDVKPTLVNPIYVGLEQQTERTEIEAKHSGRVAAAALQEHAAERDPDA